MPYPVPLNAARILIINNTPATMLLEDILRQGTYGSVRALSNPYDAVQTCTSFQPDLVVLDLHMPRMDGLALIQQLVLAGPPSGSVPILLLTDDVAPEVKQRALALGASDFVSKPFERTETLLRIKNLLEIRFLQLGLQRHANNLERQIRERTRDLEAAQFEIVERLARAAEYRDDNTGEHIRRVAYMSANIAAALKLPEPQVELIRRTAQLHDVGKIALPDHILLKQGTLTTLERRHMQTHTVIGARMLAQGTSPLVQMAEQIALTHHERWDGTGYPHGLQGAAIPLVGRIVAIADVFDALLSMRPYKPAWTREAALAEIKAQRGRQFDPHLVDVFLETQASITSKDRIDVAMRARSMGTRQLRELDVETHSLMKDAGETHSARQP